MISTKREVESAEIKLQTAHGPDLLPAKREIAGRAINPRQIAEEKLKSQGKAFRHSRTGSVISAMVVSRHNTIKRNTNQSKSALNHDRKGCGLLSEHFVLSRSQVRAGYRRDGCSWFSDAVGQQFVDALLRWDLYDAPSCELILLRNLAFYIS